MVTLGAKLVDKVGRSVITARVGDDPIKYALCVLVAGKTESFSLDLTFQGEETLVLEVSGKNLVNLVGNFGYEDDEDDDDEDDDGLIHMYDDDGMIGDDDDSDSDDDDDADDGREPKLLKDADPPIITELPDDPKATVVAVPPKKGKGSTQPPVPGKVPKAATPAKKASGNAKNSTPGGKADNTKNKVDHRNMQGADEIDDDDDDDDLDDGGQEDDDVDDDDDDVEEDVAHRMAQKHGQKAKSGLKKRGPPGHAGHTPAAKKAKAVHYGTPSDAKAAVQGSVPPVAKKESNGGGGQATPKKANGTAPKSALKSTNQEAKPGSTPRASAPPSANRPVAGPGTPASKDQARDGDAASAGPSSTAKKNRRRRRSKGGASD
jgi:Nucleoplasmin-like domain